MLGVMGQSEKFSLVNSCRLAVVGAEGDWVGTVSPVKEQLL